MNADGTSARVVSDTLALQGSPGWTRDGQSLTSGAIVDGKAQLVQLALDGTVSPLVQRFAVDPVVVAGRQRCRLLGRGRRDAVPTRGGRRRRAPSIRFPTSH